MERSLLDSFRSIIDEGNVRRTSHTHRHTSFRCTVRKRYRTEPKKVPRFATNSKPFCDIVRNFESSVKFHETFESFVKSTEGFVELYGTFKVSYDITKRLRIRCKSRDLFKFSTVPFFSVVVADTMDGKTK